MTRDKKVVLRGTRGFYHFATGFGTQNIGISQYSSPIPSKRPKMPLDIALPMVYILSRFQGVKAE
jgi:hypothetical protein